MRRDVEFNADGVTLRGWFYTPDQGKGPFACVVMAHGFSGTKEMTLDKFAEVLTIKEHESKKIQCPKCKGEELEHVIEPFFARTSSKTAGW